MQSELPSAYRKVEYLQSDGGQYIIADTKIFEDTVCKCKFVLTAPRTNQQTYASIFGIVIGASSNPGFVVFTSAQYICGRFGYWSATGTGTINTDALVEENIEYNVVCALNSITLAGQTYTGSQRWNTSLENRKMGIFCRAREDDTALNRSVTKGRIYKLSFKSASAGGNANFIPCVRKSDSKPGMYDTVSKTFYTNAGTGEFIVPA